MNRRNFLTKLGIGSAGLASLPMLGRGLAEASTTTLDAEQWSLKGDYFESCNCAVICPCVFSAGGPLTAVPTEGHCDVGFAFHIDRGNYGPFSLDGLNAAAVIRAADGPMGGGKWSLALYLDARAGGQVQEALGTIFGGSAGGPMAGFVPLIGKVLGVKSVPITYVKEGKRRSVQIPSTLQMAVQAIPSFKADGSEAWVSAGYGISPEYLALASGGSTFNDYGIRWDNAGKNSFYAPINWSNS